MGGIGNMHMLVRTQFLASNQYRGLLGNGGIEPTADRKGICLEVIKTGYSLQANAFQFPYGPWIIERPVLASQKIIIIRITLIIKFVQGIAFPFFFCPLDKMSQNPNPCDRHRGNYQGRGKQGQSFCIEGITDDRSNGSPHGVPNQVDFLILVLQFGIGIIGNPDPILCLALQKIIACSPMPRISYGIDIKTRLIKIFTRPDQFPGISGITMAAKHSLGSFLPMDHFPGARAFTYRSLVLIVFSRPVRNFIAYMHGTLLLTKAA